VNVKEKVFSSFKNSKKNVKKKLNLLFSRAKIEFHSLRLEEG